MTSSVLCITPVRALIWVPSGSGAQAILRTYRPECSGVWGTCQRSGSAIVNHGPQAASLDQTFKRMRGVRGVQRGGGRLPCPLPGHNLLTTECRLTGEPTGRNHQAGRLERGPALGRMRPWSGLSSPATFGSLAASPDNTREPRAGGADELDVLPPLLHGFMACIGDRFGREIHASEPTIRVEAGQRVHDAATAAPHLERPETGRGRSIPARAAGCATAATRARIVRYPPL